MLSVPLPDEEGVRYVPVRPRPPITLLRHYRNPWKAAYHHFQRYSDIRVKGQHISTCLKDNRVLRFSIVFILQILLSNAMERGEGAGG